jgi:hypothetical protein|tara:strand:+ start:418 stop:534 length:117 start_codon:yes stop_codon:yes gene_type:complete
MEVMGGEIVFLLMFCISRFLEITSSQMAKPKTTVKILN